MSTFVRVFAISGLTLSYFVAPSLSAQTTAPDLYDETIVRRIDVTFPTNNWLSQIVTSKTTTRYVKCDLKVDGKVYKSVGMRGRGATSWFAGTRTGKYPFKISMDAFVDGQNLYGYSSFNLNNGYWDPSLMREALAYRITRDYMPASKAAWANLWVNGVLWATYIIQEGTTKDMLRNWYHDEDGNRYKGFRVFRWGGAFPQPYFVTHPIVSSPNPGIYRDLIEVLRVLTQLPPAQRMAEAPGVFDVDQTLRYYATTVCIDNRDAYLNHNYYLYQDPWHRRMSVLPWDLNGSWRWTTAGFNFRNFPLAGVDPHIGRVYAYARTIALDTLDWTKLDPWVKRTHAMLAPHMQADPRKLEGYAAFQGDPAFLRSKIGSRRSQLLAQIPPGPVLADPDRSPQVPAANESCWLRVKAGGSAPAADVVLAHWRTRGEWHELAMFDDGKHQDGKSGDLVYGAEIPRQKAGTEVEYRFEAANASTRSRGGISFLPPSGGHRPYRYRVEPSYAGVLIGEFLARNDRGIKDQKGEREDWIEIVNPKAKPVVMDGMFLTDDVYQPEKWQFPQGTTIKPGATLLVWADKEVTEGPLHANFKLSGDGEELVLFDVDGETMLDRVVFGAQQKDVSTGRIFGRQSAIVTFAEPTPYLANGPVACGRRRYSTLDSPSHSLSLDFAGSAKLGQQGTITLARGPRNSAFLMLMAAVPGRMSVPGQRVSLMFGGPILATAAVPSDASGGARIPITIPQNPGLAGTQLYFQAVALGATLLASNGLELSFCK